MGPYWSESPLTNSTVILANQTQLGLAAVPALPYMFDKPVEEAVEWTFYHAFRTIGGENAVGARHSTGRAEALTGEARAMKKHEDNVKKDQ